MAFRALEGESVGSVPRMEEMTACVSLLLSVAVLLVAVPDSSESVATMSLKTRNTSRRSSSSPPLSVLPKTQPNHPEDLDPPQCVGRRGDDLV